MVSLIAATLPSQISPDNLLSPITIDLFAEADATRIQNARYPDRPHLPGDDFSYTETLDQLLDEIDREGYTYVGLVYRSGTLISPVRLAREYHHIFVWRDASSLPKYIYIPVRLLATGLQLLTVPAWTFDGGTLDMYEIRPNGELLPSEVEEWPRSHQIACGVYYHTLYFGLYFTGRAVEAVGGRPLWEYVDRLGWLGARGQRWLDVLPPLGMRYPLGIPIAGQLIRDVHYVEGELYLPAGGYFEVGGRYLGYHTTSYYSTTPFYLYEYGDEIYLSMEPPKAVYIDDHWNRAIPKYSQARWVWGDLPYDPLEDLGETYGGREATRLQRQSMLAGWAEVR